MTRPRHPATPRPTASARQQFHAEPGVSLLATRRHRTRRAGEYTWQTIDLVRCTAPGRIEVYLKIAFEGGRPGDFETYLTEAEARACWSFEVGCAPLCGLALPRLLSDSDRHGGDGLNLNK